MLWAFIVNGDYDSQQRQQLSKPSPAPIRPSNVFHGNPAYPTPLHPYGPSLHPQLHNSIDQLPNHTTISASTALTTKMEDSSPSPNKKPTSLFGNLPEGGKQRKFFTVEDPERSSHKVRVKMALHECVISEVPDSYRRQNSVYPRSWFPTQMQLSPSSRGSRGRFLEERIGEAEAESHEETRNGTLMVKVPMLEGRQGELKVPGLGRKARQTEEQLNDMGYRISWTQSRTFAGRVMFLQQSLDVYRSKMKDAMVAGGQEVETLPPVFETRAGKKSWMARRGKVTKGKGDRS